MTEAEARQIVRAALPAGQRVLAAQLRRAAAALAAGNHARARDALRELGISGLGINEVLLAGRGGLGRRLCDLALDVHFFRSDEAAAELRGAGLSVDPDGALRPFTRKD